MQAGRGSIRTAQASKSGLGSEETSTIASSLSFPRLLHSLHCKVLLDVGCGDWNWMKNVQLPCGYIGIDIVPEVIEANLRHKCPRVEFCVVDAVNSALPDADVALCREILFHLSFQDAQSALSKIV